MRSQDYDLRPINHAVLNMSERILPGQYRHFKGGLYEVLGIARHSETQEEMIVYRPLDGDGGWWVRPRAMFQEKVLFHGRSVPRFSRIDSATGEELFVP